VPNLKESQRKTPAAFTVHWARQLHVSGTEHADREQWMSANFQTIYMLYHTNFLKINKKLPINYLDVMCAQDVNRTSAIHAFLVVTFALSFSIDFENMQVTYCNSQTILDSNNIILHYQSSNASFIEFMKK